MKTMKKLINLLKDFLKKGQPVIEKNNPAYFEEKLRSMKVELVSEKSECCKTSKTEEAKVNPKPPVKKPVAKKPAPKKPKAE